MNNEEDIEKNTVGTVTYICGKIAKVTIDKTIYHKENIIEFKDFIKTISEQEWIN